MPQILIEIISIMTLALAFAAFSPARAQPLTPDSPASQPSPQIDSQADQDNRAVERELDRNERRIQLNAVAFGDIIDFMRDTTNLNIYVDWKTLALAGVSPTQTLITISRNNIPLRQVFSELLAATGSDALEFQVAHGVVLISTKLDFEDRKKQIGPYLTSLSDVERAAPFLNKRIPKVQLNSVALSDAIDFLRDVTGAQIWVRWKPVKAIGIQQNTQVVIQMNGIGLSAILYVLLDQAGGGKLGYTALPAQRPGHDRAHNPITVKTVLITISTVDDLLANPPTTRPGP